MLHAQFSRVCRCPNAKTCSSVFGRIKDDALGMVFVLSARVKAGNIVRSVHLGPVRAILLKKNSGQRSGRLELPVNIKVSAGSC